MPLHTGDLQNLIAYNRAQAAVSPSLNPTFEGSSPGTVLELRAAPLRVHLGKLTAEGRLTRRVGRAGRAEGAGRGEGGIGD
jgi:hypothetical protein